MPSHPKASSASLTKRRSIIVSRATFFPTHNECYICCWHHNLQSPDQAVALDGRNAALLTISVHWPAASEPHCQLRHEVAFDTVRLEEIPGFSCDERKRVREIFVRKPPIKPAAAKVDVRGVKDLHCALLTRTQTPLQHENNFVEKTANGNAETLKR